MAETENNFNGEDQKSEKETTIERILRLREESISQSATAIANTKTNWSYFENDPYTSTEKTDAKKYGKALLKYPVMQNKLLIMIGREEQQRKEAKIKTDDKDQFDTVDILNRHYSFLRAQNDMNDKQSKLMTDGLINQIGAYVRAYVEMNDRGYLDLNWENLDAFDVHPDPSFKRLDLKDCKWIERDIRMSIDEMKAEFAGFHDADDWSQVEAHLIPTEEKSLGGDLEVIGDQYPLCEFQERVMQHFVIMNTDEGIQRILLKDKKKALKAGYQIIRHVSKEIIHKTVVSPFHKEILFDQDINNGSDYFDIFTYFSYDYNVEKIKIPSMVGLLTDVQDQINKEKSQNTQFAKQALDIIWHVGRNDPEAVERLEGYKGEPKLVVPYKNLDNRAIRDEPGGGAIAAIQALAGNVLGNIDLISEVSGIKEPLSGGGVKSSTSGVLYERQQESAATGVNPFFEILAKVRKYMCDHYLKIAPDMYKEHLRVLEIEPDKNDYENFARSLINIPFEGDILNDIKQMSARATIDDGERSSDYRDEMFEKMMGFVHVMSQTGASFEQLPWMYLLEYSKMRNKDKLTEFIVQQMYNTKQMKLEQNVDARLQGAASGNR